MEEHRSFLAACYRLCARSLEGKINVAHKRSFKQELWLKFGINVDADSEEIHPASICPVCKRLLYRVRGATDISAVSTSSAAVYPSDSISFFWAEKILHQESRN